jgi:hypothetical protein
VQPDCKTAPINHLWRFVPARFSFSPFFWLRAQTPAQEVVIRTHAYTPPSTILHAESNLVEAGLTVRDSNGRAVAGLQASDFEVFDNGVPQTMVPAYCGVSPIDSYIFRHNLDGDIREKAIAAAMLCASCDGRNGSAAQCRATAYGIAQQAASSVWEQLQAQSLDTLSAAGFAAKRLSQMKGSRILVVTSFGFLLRPGVQPELQNFIDSAVRWGVVVHAIGAQGSQRDA